jgi:hypothetical protein
MNNIDYMKNSLLIFFLSFTTISSFAQQKFSHADSLILARVVTLGSWTGNFITDENGHHYDGDAPNWPTNVLIDSFAEKSLDVQDVFDFVKEHGQLLYKYFGSDLYFLAITKSEIVGIKVSNGKPEINDRTQREGTHHNASAYWKPGHRYIKIAPAGNKFQ